MRNYLKNYLKCSCCFFLAKNGKEIKKISGTGHANSKQREILFDYHSKPTEQSFQSSKKLLHNAKSRQLSSKTRLTASCTKKLDCLFNNANNTIGYKYHGQDVSEFNYISCKNMATLPNSINNNTIGICNKNEYLQQNRLINKENHYPCYTSCPTIQLHNFNNDPLITGKDFQVSYEL